MEGRKDNLNMAASRENDPDCSVIVLPFFLTKFDFHSLLNENCVSACYKGQKGATQKADSQTNWYNARVTWAFSSLFVGGIIWTEVRRCHGPPQDARL